MLLLPTSWLRAKLRWYHCLHFVLLLAKPQTELKSWMTLFKLTTTIILRLCALIIKEISLKNWQIVGVRKPVKQYILCNYPHQTFTNIIWYTKIKSLEIAAFKLIPIVWGLLNKWWTRANKVKSKNKDSHISTDAQSWNNKEFQGKQVEDN